MWARRIAALAMAFSMLAAGTARASQTSIHAWTIRSAEAQWIVGPAAGGGRVRYVDAFYLEETRDGSTQVIASIFMGTCRSRARSLSHCRTYRAVDQNDYDPRFTMDPALQTASLDLGPNHVEWISNDVPQVTFLEVVCDPNQQDDYPGPDLGREAVANGTLFGRKVSTESNGSDEGFLTTGALLTPCAWRSFSSGITPAERVN